MEIAQEVKEMLAEKGYKPEFGARELRRVVERELDMKLADKLMASGGYKPVWKILLKSDTVDIV